MKITKILAAASAAIISASVLAATACAHETFLMYTDNSWLWGCWSAA